MSNAAGSAPSGPDPKRRPVPPDASEPDTELIDSEPRPPRWERVPPADVSMWDEPFVPPDVQRAARRGAWLTFAVAFPVLLSLPGVLGWTVLATHSSRDWPVHDGVAFLGAVLLAILGPCAVYAFARGLLNRGKPIQLGAYQAIGLAGQMTFWIWCVGWFVFSCVYLLTDTIG